MSGGATMANALGCRLGPSVVRGLGIHSGTLYPTDDASGKPEFSYTDNGGVSCALPDTLFVWGKADNTEGVSYAQGQSVRDNYLATQSCANTSEPWTSAPCVRYDACQRDVVWCAVDGLGHSIWPGAAQAIWSFFDGKK
jgi:poly(3-hydroxybutyrate) depolymerase